MERQELEKLTRDYQTIQEQMQALSVQKEQFNVEKEEHKEALAEIEKSTGKVFVTLGGAIVEVSKEEALKRIKEREESITMRLTIINKQYEDASKKEKSLREQITGALKEQQGTGAR
ncbi:MAG: prefoldin subunit [Candidatus Marsarchaeota archaeon]|nr:prefoldin subunit [Candidatus Marsarchaeota archaeon]